MAQSLEDLLRAWSKPPSATEEERCSNAEAVVRNAVQSYGPFASRQIQVFAQGSYRNGTNVRVDSDVDVCVRCMDVCFLDLPTGYSKSAFGLVDATYTYTQFKDDVEHALRNYLGAFAVSRSNKAFDLHANTYRIDADVVPTFEHRRYWVQNGQYGYDSGTAFRPDKGGRIINWPEQNYENGTAKNDTTGTRFKKMVRVLKCVRNEMTGRGIAEATPIPSYLIECLAWNVPNAAFGHDDYTDDLREVLLRLFGATQDDGGCSEWREVNELKYLFRRDQPWTRQAANDFIVAAWAFAALQ